ncbi:MAG: DsbA family protein [Pseudomonadota bacterium]
MSAEVIDAYFSVNSPWAFLGGRALRRLRDALGATVRPRLINAADVFGPTGTLPLPQRPKPRQDYRFVELRRWSAKLGVPLVLEPKHFPIPERAAHGALLAAGDAGLDVRALADAIGRAIWVEQRNAGDHDELAAVLTGAGAPDGAKLIAAGADVVFDRRLADNAADALAAGAFGFPWYVFRGEPYWGQDRLSFIEDALRGE